MSSKDIINKIKELIPGNADISDYSFEGANIVLYSKNKTFALNSKDITKKIVDLIHENKKTSQISYYGEDDELYVEFLYEIG